MDKEAVPTGNSGEKRKAVFVEPEDDEENASLATTSRVLPRERYVQPPLDPGGAAFLKAAIEGDIGTLDALLRALVVHVDFSDPRNV